jgi:hypothetical protein
VCEGAFAHIWLWHVIGRVQLLQGFNPENDSSNRHTEPDGEGSLAEDLAGGVVAQPGVEKALHILSCIVLLGDG